MAKLTKRDNIIQAVKFTLFSISAGVIQAASFALLHELTDLPYWPAYLTASSSWARPPCCMN